MHQKYEEIQFVEGATWVGDHFCKLPRQTDAARLHSLQPFLAMAIGQHEAQPATPRTPSPQVDSRRQSYISSTASYQTARDSLAPDPLEPRL